jgi:hypothetical protein
MLDNFLANTFLGLSGLEPLQTAKVQLELDFFDRF